MISGLMHSDFLRFDPDDDIREATRRLSESGKAEGLVVNRDGIYFGILRVQACLAHKPSSPVRDAADRDALKFDETTSVWQAMEAFREFLGEVSPVVSATDNRLLGAVSESAVIAAYLDTVDRLRREENESV